MSGTIAVTNDPDNTWLYAGWAYGMVTDRLLSTVSLPEDKEQVVMFEAFQDLSLDTLPQDQAIRIAQALAKVIQELQEDLRRDGTRPIDFEFADFLTPLLECLLSHYGHETQ